MSAASVCLSLLKIRRDNFHTCVIDHSVMFGSWTKRLKRHCVHVKSKHDDIKLNLSKITINIRIN